MRELSRERLVLKLLKHFNEGEFNTYKNLNMDFQEYAKLIQNMEEEHLIQDVEIIYADNNQVYELVTDNIKVTPDGIEYLKNIDNEMQKNILEALYDYKRMANSQIRRHLFLSLTILEVDSQLSLLKINNLIETERENNTTYYKLSQSGIDMVEESFKEDQVIKYNFPSINDIKTGIDKLIIESIQDQEIKKELKMYLDELIEESSKEKIEKSKLKDIFIKIANKGFDEITDSSFTLFIGYILES